MHETQAPPSHFAKRVPMVLVVLGAVIGFLTLREYLSFDVLRDNREALLAYRDAHFALLAAVFVAAYVVIVAFSLPGGAVASVTGGFLFGLVLGTALNVVAATIGAIAIFGAVRAGFGDALSRKMDQNDTAAKLRAGLKDNEINVLLLLRLVPVVPFFVANLLPALVGVRFVNFAWTTFIGIIPGGVVFTWIGVGVAEVFDRGETPDVSLLWEPHVIGPILGLAALAALPMIMRAFGKKEAV